NPGRRNLLPSYEVPIAGFEHLVAAYVDNLPRKDEDTADWISGSETEISHGVVSYDKVLHIGNTNRPEGAAGRLGQRSYLTQQGTGDRIRADVQVLNTDNLRSRPGVEKSDRPDAACTGVADTVAIDLNVNQIAGGYDSAARLAGVAGSDLEGGRRIARARNFYRRPTDSPRVVPVRVEYGHTP